jgi:hypothetical protein
MRIAVVSIEPYREVGVGAAEVDRWNDDLVATSNRIGEASGWQDCLSIKSRTPHVLVQLYPDVVWLGISDIVVACLVKCDCGNDIFSTLQAGLSR